MSPFNPAGCSARYTERGHRRSMVFFLLHRVAFENSILIRHVVSLRTGRPRWISCCMPDPSHTDGQASMTELLRGRLFDRNQIHASGALLGYTPCLHTCLCFVQPPGTRDAPGPHKIGFGQPGNKLNFSFVCSGPPPPLPPFVQSWDELHGRTIPFEK